MRRVAREVVRGVQVQEQDLTVRRAFGSERVGWRARGGVFEGRRLSEGRRGWEGGGEERRRPWWAGGRRVLAGRVRCPWLEVGIAFVIEDCIGVVCDALLSRSCWGCAEEAWTNWVDGRSLEVLNPVQGLGI